MSKAALAKIVQRAISDASFRRQLNTDTAGALRGFDLTADEVSALRAGDAGRLTTLGVDHRMSKSFALGGMAAATRMAQSDLTVGAPTAFDDGASGVGRMIIPHDPEAASTKDLDGGPGSNRSVLNDDPDGFLAANARASGGTGSVRTGDDWKYADKSVAQQGSVAPLEGSPEATAAEIAASGAGRIGTARLDDASGGTAGEGTAFVDESEAYLTKVGYDSAAATTANTRATWSGDENAGPASVAADHGGASPNATEGGPNITP